MIPITAKVSNAIAAYEMHFGKRIVMGDLSRYETPDRFVFDVEVAIENDDPVFGGVRRGQEDKNKQKKRRKNEWR